MLRILLRLSALLVILAFSANSQVRADYLYTVSGLPAPIVSGQSIVVFSATPSPNQPLPGNTSMYLALANVLGFSTNVAGGDSFNTPFTLKVNFADPAHPESAAVASFTGTLSGMLGRNQLAFVQFPVYDQLIDLAGNTYAVSVERPSPYIPEDVFLPYITIPVSNNGTQQGIAVSVKFTGFQVYTAPEPSSLLLAGLGIPLVGLLRQRKRAARE